MNSKNDSDSTALLKISPKFTEATIHEIVKCATGSDNIRLVRYEIKEASARGDSYLSTVSRIIIEGESLADNKPYTLALIVKSLPANIGRRKTFRSTEFFLNEVSFYEKVLPKFMAFQESKKLQFPFCEIPRCYKALADGENDFIVLEDLSQCGFQPANRMEGLDYDHCCRILQILGRFHALSFAMKDQDPITFQEMTKCLKETYYSTENKGWYEEQLRKFCLVAMDAVTKEYPGSIYEKKLKEFTDDTLFERMVELVQPREPYAVIGHGDTWAPNFLFTYTPDPAKIERTKMLDFQLARYGSPVLDVSFFIYSCTTKELRDGHFGGLLQEYYDSFARFLRELGSSPETLFPHNCFYNEVAANSVFGLGMSLESVPLSIMDESETPDIDLINGNDAVNISQENCTHPSPLQSYRYMTPMHCASLHKENEWISIGMQEYQLLYKSTLPGAAI